MSTPSKYHSFLKPFHMYFIRMHILALSPIFYIWLLFTIFNSTALFLATISSVLYLVSLITLFPPFSPSQQQVINQVILIPWFRCSSGFIEVRIQFTLSHSCLPFLRDCTIWPSSLWSHLPYATPSLLCHSHNEYILSLLLKSLCICYILCLGGTFLPCFFQSHPLNMFA